MSRQPFIAAAGAVDRFVRQIQFGNAASRLRKVGQEEFDETPLELERL